MNTVEYIKKLEANKIIAIIRGCTPDQCLQASRALYEGGICFVEITFDHTGRIPYSDTLSAIHMIRCELDGKVEVGAGTVLEAAQVEDAFQAGATYIISPDINESVITRTTELGLISIPGAFSPTEIASAYRVGAHIVKVFPAGRLGPSYIKALKGPLAHIPLLAVGGISHENLHDFLIAGCCGAGIGGSLVDKHLIEMERFDLIKEIAQITVNAALSAYA